MQQIIVFHPIIGNMEVELYMYTFFSILSNHCLLFDKVVPDLLMQNTQQEAHGPC